MKRFRRFSLIFFVLILLSLFPLQQQSSAADRSYFISGYNINVNVNADGSADFQEELTYGFNGSFNGILRDVDFSKSGGIENQTVYVESGGNLTELTQNQTDSLDYQGEPGTYNLSVEGNIAHFKVFEHSQDEDKTFVFKYRMKDTVTVYNDTAEFYRFLVWSGWDISLQNVHAIITLPEGATSEELKVFAHGPLTGESKKVDGRTLDFEVPQLSPGETLEARVLFPVKLVPDANKRVNEDALPGIMESEGKNAEEANKVREEAKKQVEEYQKRQAQEQARQENLMRIGTPLAMVLFVLWFPLIIFIYIKYDRELKHGFEAKYYRELPGEYSPAEMTVLMTMGSVNSRDIMATLMDLVRKKQLFLTSGKTVKAGFFGSKEIDDYVIAAG